MAKKQRTLRNPLVGRKIVGVRAATVMEQQANGWHDSFAILELDDGSQLFSMADEEGNRPGVLIHETIGGTQYYISG